jgi:hypothetical protein
LALSLDNSSRFKEVSPLAQEIPRMPTAGLVGVVLHILSVIRGQSGLLGQVLSSSYNCIIQLCYDVYVGSLKRICLYEYGLLRWGYIVRCDLVMALLPC